MIDRALAAADHQHHPSEEPRPRSYLTRGVYVDQLQRWHGFFPSERLLVVRSEDLFERPAETVGRVLDFPGPRGRQQQRYRRFNTHPHSPIPKGMRMRLREYFRPHNARLSAHLGWNLDWDA